MMNKKKWKKISVILFPVCLSVGISVGSAYASDAEAETDFSDGSGFEKIEGNDKDVSEETELTIGQDEDGWIGADTQNIVSEEDSFENGEQFLEELRVLEQEKEQLCGVGESMISWTIDEEGVLKINGQGAMQHWESEEAVPWNSDRQKIKKIEIEDGVTSIGAYAFCNCPNVAEVVIPESVQEFGEYAFFNCSGLSTITIG